MKMKSALAFLFVMLLLGWGLAQEIKPVAVSPGSERGVARVSERCPTFSWSAIAWAAGYRVVVFEVQSAEVKTYESMALAAAPILRQDIQGKALSWTPSEGSGLKDGGMYVWYVQARDTSGNGLWSAGKTFLVAMEKAPIIGVEERVAKKLRERGVAVGVISEADKETRFRAKAGIISKEFTLKGSGQTAAGIQAGGGGLGGVITQGHESDTNTWFGYNAGYTLSTVGTGLANSFFGDSAGYYTNTGSNNTFLGYQAGPTNSSGSRNTFVGHLAGAGNGASDNTYVGDSAGLSNMSGSFNTIIGANAGYSNINSWNTFIGGRAGQSNTSGYQNAYLGGEAGYATNTGNMNTFIGYVAGHNTTSGYQNTFLGRASGYDNTTGRENTFIGTSAGEKNLTGLQNTFVGHTAGHKNTVSYSTALGYGAGYNTATGYFNTFVGYKAAYTNSTGDYNTALGVNAGYLNSSGLRNVFLGYGAGYFETGSDKLYIANSTATFPLIYGNFSTSRVGINGYLGVGVQTASYRIHVAGGAYCNGTTWTNASSRSLKENIRALRAEDAYETLLNLAPVRFNYKADTTDECLGFIAEDVPSLVATGDRKGLSPMDIVAVLTKVVQEQQKTIDAQQKTIDELRGYRQAIDDLRAEINALKKKAE